MTAPRIGKEGSAEPARSRSSSIGASGFGRALASPYAVLVVFPSIVLAVGLFLALVGQRALKVSNVALGERRLTEQAQLVASRLGAALEAADPMLDRLSDFALTHAPDQPLEGVAAVLADLMQGRAGVAYASISFPDGTFQGSYVDEDGRLRFQDSRVGPEGTLVRRYDYRGHGLITLRSEATSAYDPRRRAFYTLASDTRRRIWTDPYVFYGTHYTGVTRSAPVYRQEKGERRLHAVLTVDFDVSELSRLARSSELEGMRTLLFTTKGTLLAYTQHGKNPVLAPADHVLTYRDLNDATLNAFFAAFAARDKSAARLLAFDVAGSQHLGALARLSRDQTLDFHVAYLVPESVFFESLHTYGRRSFGIAAVAVLLALGVSVALVSMALAARSGPLVLVALAVGSLPWPLWVSIDDGGLELRSGFVKQLVPASELVGARVIVDDRRWSWPRGKVLVIERRSQPRVLVFARETTIARLADALQQPSDPPSSPP